MNKVIAFAGLAVLAASTSAVAQGTILASSSAMSAPRSVIVDGTKAGSPKIFGSGYSVDVLIQDPAAGNAYKSIFSAPIPALGSSASAGLAGLFSGGSVAVPFLAPGATATVKIQAWDNSTGASFAAASVKAESSAFQYVLAGSGTPPSTPAAFTTAQFGGLTLVPEPSTYALAALGLGALLYFRRK